MPKVYMLQILVAFLFLNLCSCKIVKWDNATSGNWANPACWDVGHLPTDIDDVYITLSGNYTVFVTIGSVIRVRSLTIGGYMGTQILDVYIPFVVQESSKILPNGVVQLGSSLHGMGSIEVEGKLKLCGDFKSAVNISAVDILEGGNFEVWYQSNKSTRDCYDFPNSTNGKKQYVIEDDVFGVPLANGEVSVIVPSTRNVYELLSESEHQFYVQIVAQQLSQISGGATTIPGFGYWISDNKTLIREKVTIVSVAAQITPDLKIKLKQLARWLVRDLQQEAVFVKVDGMSFLVTNGA